MIELSKCPNCAIDDQVTIAGKTFCMRCGTPEEDNAIIMAGGAVPEPIVATTVIPSPPTPTIIPLGTSTIRSMPDPIVAAAVTASSPTPSIIPPGTSASISRFGSPQDYTAITAHQQPPLAPGVPPSPAMTDPILEVAPEPIAEPALKPIAPHTLIIEPTAPPTPILTPIAPSVPAPAPAPIVVDMPMPVQVPAQPQQDATAIAVDNKINALSSEPEAPTMPMPTPLVATADAITKPAVESIADVDTPLASTLPPDVPEAPDQTINIATTPDAQPSPESATASTNQENTPPTAPSPPSMNDISSPSMASDSVMPMTLMSLDKNDAGGFSDEELNSLTATSSGVESTIPSPLAQPIDIATPLAPSPNNSLLSEPQDVPPQSQSTLAIPHEQTLPEMAMANNVSVKGPSRPNKVLKPAAVVASILLLFITGAYLWSVNYSSMAFKIASSKAGVSVSMPSYLPPGYGLSGNIKTNPGSVSYNLSNSSNKKITLSQSKTEWDSQALAENYVSPKSENYLSLQAQGLTIYLMGGNEANWVNKGMWYKLDISDQALTQDQIIKMATSLWTIEHGKNWSIW